MVKHSKLGRPAYAQLSRRPLRLEFVRQDLLPSLAPYFADVEADLRDRSLSTDAVTAGLSIQSAIVLRTFRVAHGLSIAERSADSVRCGVGLRTSEGETGW
jgi:hypothetical protein